MKIIRSDGSKKIFCPNDPFWFNENNRLRTKYKVVMGDKNLYEEAVSSGLNDFDVLIDSDLLDIDGGKITQINNSPSYYLSRYEEPLLYTKSMMGLVANDISFGGLAVFKNKLFFGTGNSTAGNGSNSSKLVYFDGQNFGYYTKGDMGFSSSSAHTLSGSQVVIWNNKLWFEAANTNSTNTDYSATCLVSFDGNSFNIYSKQDIGLVGNDLRIFPVGVFQNKLVLGTHNTTAATDINGSKVIIYDGTNFQIFTKSQIGGVNSDVSFIRGVSFNDKFYIGGYNSTNATDSTALKLFIYDGSNWSTLTKSQIGGVGADVQFSVVYSIGNMYLILGTENSTGAVDSTASKLIIYNNYNWFSIIKDSLNLSSANTIPYTPVFFDGYLFIPWYNTTNWLSSICFVVISFNLIPFIPSVPTRITTYYNFKPLILLTETNEYINNIGVFDNSVYAVTYSPTAAVDYTGSKLVVIYKGVKN